MWNSSVISEASQNKRGEVTISGNRQKSHFYWWNDSTRNAAVQLYMFIVVFSDTGILGTSVGRNAGTAVLVEFLIPDRILWSGNEP